MEDVLARHASRASMSRGRLYQEAESDTRTAYQRDRDRVIHCSAFRRLKHKTQVFVYHEGDHYRTRLTHSIEVAQIARTICRVLALNEDLAEALALAHDFGHTPFGHAGEDALDDAMADYGGFDHNAQTIRLVTRLERRYACFPGLNLTWETLEGLAKHNGPLVAQPLEQDQTPANLPFALVDFLADMDLELHTHAGPEAQVAAIADDIAYNNHDIDDGLRAGLFTLDDLAQIGFVGAVIDRVRAAYPDVERGVLIHEVVRRLIDLMVTDIVAETRRRLADTDPASADDVRAAGRPTVAFSDAMAAHERELKAFLRANMYQHYLVNRTTTKAKRVVTDLFDLYIQEPQCLPTEWARATSGPRTDKTARAVADFIAGMTDRFAIREHTKLFDISVLPV